MYCPDVAVTERQLNAGTSTYHEIVQFHVDNDTLMPLNINGKPIIRKLSDLATDIEALISEADIRKRFTVDF
jgi:hypothetical protein